MKINVVTQTQFNFFYKELMTIFRSIHSDMRQLQREIGILRDQIQMLEAKR